MADLPGTIKETAPAPNVSEHPLATSEEASKAKKKRRKAHTIDLNDPNSDPVEAHVRAALKKFDQDRDGQFSYNEVVAMVKAYMEEEGKAKKNRRWAICMGFFGSFGFIAAILAVVIGSFAVKDQATLPSGEMMSQPGGGLFPGPAQPATVGSAEQAFELEAVGAMEDDELANLGAFSLTHAGVQYFIKPALVMRNDGEGYVEIVGGAGIRIRVTTLDEMMLMLPGNGTWVDIDEDDAAVTEDNAEIPPPDPDEDGRRLAEGRRLAARRRSGGGSSSSSAPAPRRRSSSGGWSAPAPTPDSGRRRAPSTTVVSSGRRRSTETTVVVTSRRRHSPDVIVIGDEGRRRYHTTHVVHHDDRVVHHSSSSGDGGFPWGAIVFGVIFIIILCLLLGYCKSDKGDTVYIHDDISSGSEDVVVITHSSPGGGYGCRRCEHGVPEHEYCVRCERGE